MFFVKRLKKNKYIRTHLELISNSLFLNEINLIYFLYKQARRKGDKLVLWIEESS